MPETSLKRAVLSGVKKGWRAFVWILKILIPVSLLTVFLEHSGWLLRMDFLLEPAMGLLGLPPAAALPLMIGMLANIYGAVAAMAVMSFTTEQATLIAVFLLISHSLTQEVVIQARAGFKPWKSLVSRLTASALTVAVLARIISPDPSAAAAAVAPAAPAAKAFGTVIAAWCADTLFLSVKMLLIILALMTVLEALKHFRLIEKLVNGLTFVFKALGVDKQAGVLWLTAAVFGISYGAAVIVEESRENNLSKDALNKLHLSIGVNHAMIEDPALFLPLGLNPFWLYVPRLIAAAAAVHLASLCQAAFRKIFAKPAGRKLISAPPEAR